MYIIHLAQQGKAEEKTILDLRVDDIYVNIKGRKRKVSCERQRGAQACIFSSTRFVSHLSDRQFLRLDNFHIPRILDIEAFLWAATIQDTRLCVCEYMRTNI